MKSLKLLALCVGLSLAQAANADITLEYRVVEAGAKTDKLQSILVKDGRVLAKGAGDGGSMDLIYTQTPEQLFIIDHRKRNVMTLDEKQINRLAKQAETVEPLLQGFGEQIAKLNPKQRAKWEEILGGKVSLNQFAKAAKPTQPVNIVKTGKGRNVGGVDCELMSVFQGRTQTAEFCLAGPGKLNIQESDYMTLRSLLSFSERLASKSHGLAKQFGVDIPNLDLRDLAGVPIEMSETSSGSLKLNRVLTSAVSAELMEIPAGYQSEPFNLWK